MFFLFSWIVLQVIDKKKKKKKIEELQGGAAAEHTWAFSVLGQ